MTSAQPDPIIVVAYDSDWPEQFRGQAVALRQALGEVALRIDHIGSTAVPGLAAKPIIDVQVSVADLDHLDDFVPPLQRLGYIFHPENTERTKRYFREPHGARRSHIHVRRAGSFSEQLALLFRDYLRDDPVEAEAYAALKWKLAQQYRDDRNGYVEAKGPHIWAAIARADAWAQLHGWQPGPSDA